MASAQGQGRDFRDQGGSDRSKHANLIDDFSDPVSNEGNLLTLMTLQNVLKSQPGEDPNSEQSVFRAMAKEETRHLRTAMRVLTAKDGPQAVLAGVSTFGNGPAAQNQAILRARQLQAKFGKDMAGAVKLAKLLKSESDELEVRSLLRPFALAATAKKGDPNSRSGGFYNVSENEEARLAGPGGQIARENAL